jgi:hypothetical protein
MEGPQAAPPAMCVCVCVCVVGCQVGWHPMTGSVSLGGAGERACEGCEPLPPHHQHILCCEHAKELRASCPSTASAKPRGATILPGGGQAGWAAWTACTAGWMYGGRSCGTGPAEPVAFVARPRWGRGVGPPPGGLRGGGCGGGVFPPPFCSRAFPGSSIQRLFTVRSNSLPRGAGLQWRARSAGCSWVAAEGGGKEAAGAVGASGWVLSLPGR